MYVMNSVSVRQTLIILCAAATVSGCDMTKFAANSTVGVMKQAAGAFTSEHDPWLARRAATGNLKFAEGILRATPENEDLLILLAKNYNNYAFAFLMEDLDNLNWGTDEFTEVSDRAIDFFTRSRQYAVQRLALDFEDAGTAVFAPGERLEQILGEAEPEKHLSALYWLASSWGNIISLQSDDPDILADLPRVKRIMQWVRKHDGNYANGGAHLFFGVINTALPKQLGGDPEAAKQGFLDGIAVSNGRYLMGKALYGYYYFRAVDDREGYVKTLQEVLDTPGDIMPEQRLANELAKIRAQRWLGEVDEYFE